MREEIVVWSNKFPLDRWWRLKYNIPYNSFEHREISQVDIFFEWYEEQLFIELEQESKLLKEKEEQLRLGYLISPRSSEVKVDYSAFDDIDLSNFNIE